MSILHTVRSIASRSTSSMTRVQRLSGFRYATIQYHHPSFQLLVQTAYFTPSSSHSYSHQIQIYVYFCRLVVCFYISTIVTSMYISKCILLYSPKIIVMLSGLQVPSISLHSNDPRLQTVLLYSFTPTFNCISKFTYLCSFRCNYNLYNCHSKTDVS